MGIIYAILIFSIVVVIHELGHFLLAKVNGITVFEFSLGMGPKLISKQIGDTLYCIKLLPLGGSCMMGEDFNEDGEQNQKEEEDDFDSLPELRGNFNEKSVGARVAVIAGGPIFNFILAFICAVMLVAWTGYDAPVISQITEGSAAEEAGLKVGDEITKMNHKTINLWREVTSYTYYNGSAELEVMFIRDGEKYKTTLIPQYSEDLDRYLIGIVGSGYVDATLMSSFEYGIYITKYYMLAVVDSLKMLFAGSANINDLSGPVGIVEQVGSSYQESVKIGWDVVFLNMLHLIILLSANLGVMNLLPIPALDGGRLVFLGIEGIRGKPLSPDKEGMIHLIGFGLLMLLMVFVLFNDIRKIIGF